MKPFQISIRKQLTSHSPSNETVMDGSDDDGAVRFARKQDADAVEDTVTRI